MRHGGDPTPGEGLRVTFGSEAAHTPGSQNMTGTADPVVDALIEKALNATSRAELTTVCRALDRVLRAGYYWVPMWNKANHLVAYWDLFSRPAQSPKYGLSTVGTWWYDEAKAKKTALITH